MKNLENRNVCGFSFIEVLTAISISGLMLTSIFALQNTAFFSLMRYSSNLRALIFMNNELTLQHREQLLSKEKKNKATTVLGNTSVVYTRSKVPERSSMAKCCDLYIEKLNTSWQQLGITYQEYYITFQYAPVKTDKEKAKT